MWMYPEGLLWTCLYLLIPTNWVSVKHHTVSVGIECLGQFVDVEAAGRCVNDVLVYASLAVQLVGVARLLYATLLHGIDDIAVDDLRYAV